MSWTHARSKLANNTKLLGPDHPETVAARIELRAARLAEYVARVVAEAPPLTPDQLADVAALLRAGDVA